MFVAGFIVDVLPRKLWSFAWIAYVQTCDIATSQVPCRSPVYSNFSWHIAHAFWIKLQLLVTTVLYEFGGSVATWIASSFPGKMECWWEVRWSDVIELSNVWRLVGVVCTGQSVIIQYHIETYKAPCATIIAPFCWHSCDWPIASMHHSSWDTTSGNEWL